MTLDIVPYGHPALRAKGRRIENIDARIRALANEMLETMYAAEGVGLAAQQVGLPVQLCVIDVKGVKDRPSTLRIGGRGCGDRRAYALGADQPRNRAFRKA